jgi:hypothetical protein
MLGRVLGSSISRITSMPTTMKLLSASERSTSRCLFGGSRRSGSHTATSSLSRPLATLTQQQQQPSCVGPPLSPRRAQALAASSVSRRHVLMSTAAAAASQPLGEFCVAEHMSVQAYV